MKGQVEHANINVKDLDETVQFLITALPHFKVRHRGVSSDGVPWLHIGTNETYLALNQPPREVSEPSPRLNHVGFVVENVEEVKRRCIDAGYKEGMVPESHPHRKRIYVFDHEGSEWEFVEYLSKDPGERNDYSLSQ